MTKTKTIGVVGTFDSVIANPIKEALEQNVVKTLKETEYDKAKAPRGMGLSARGIYIDYPITLTLKFPKSRIKRSRKNRKQPSTIIVEDSILTTPGGFPNRLKDLFKWYRKEGFKILDIYSEYHNTISSLGLKYAVKTHLSEPIP